MFEDYTELSKATEWWNAAAGQEYEKTAEHKCTCGACANCRANAGSKDNMRVQDKNPKKVPVKDYEITGEDAWKGVPHVKTKVKSSAEATPPATPPAATAKSSPYSQSQFDTDLNEMRYKGPLAEFRPQSLAPEYLSPQGQADRRMTIAGSRTKSDPSPSNYSRQAGQWLSNKMGYGKQFAGLGSTWQSLLPALLGAGGLTAGAYGLSHLFGGSDKEEDKTASAYPALAKDAGLKALLQPTIGLGLLPPALLAAGGFGGAALGAAVGGPVGMALGGGLGGGLGTFAGIHYSLPKRLKKQKQKLLEEQERGEELSEQDRVTLDYLNSTEAEETLSKASAYLKKEAVEVADAITPTAAAAALGALVNLIKDKSVLRGAGTGALAGLGGFAGHELGSHLGAGSAINSRPGGPAGSATPQDQHALGLRTGIGGTSGAAAGAYGGYELAQSLWGDEDEESFWPARKTAGCKVKLVKKKKSKTKESVVNKKVAADLLWCARQLVKQAEPSPYEQMTPQYLQKAIGAVGSGLKDMGQGLSDTLTNRKTDYSSQDGDGQWRTTEVKPSLSSAMGAGLSAKGLLDHLGITTLMGPNPMGNVARVGGNYARGIYNSVKDRKPGQNLFSSSQHVATGSPFDPVERGHLYNQQGALNLHNILQKGLGPERTPEGQENPVGWQRLTGFPVGPEGMANMGDPAKRQQAAAAFNKTLNARPGPAANRSSE